MKKIFIILLLSLLFNGCSKDLLNPKQVDLVYNETFWKTQTDAETGLLGVYALYRGLMIDGNWYERGDATTGFFNRGWNGGSSDQLYLAGNYSSASSTQKSWGSLEGFSEWSKYYKVIADDNLVIKEIEGMSDGLFTNGNKNKFLGEAYFLRALVYFNILRIWGNAPYISDAILSSKQVINNDLTPVLIPRTKDTVIGRKVLADVNVAISKLKYGTPGSVQWGIRANRGSAEALAGHANMWMNFLAIRDKLPNPGKYITDAITALESLRTNGGYSLVSYNSPDALNTLYKSKSSEAVFELNVSSSDKESYRVDFGGIASFTSEITPIDGDSTKNRASSINFMPFAQKNLVYPEYDFVNQSGDSRANLFFAAWNSPYNDPFSDVSSTSTNRNLVTWMKKYSMMTIDPSHVWDEYVAYFSEANIPVFRYTDAYLLLAEAYTKSNQGAKAKEIVDVIRIRAGLTPYSGSDILKEVLQQRVSELIGEGQIYYDMVRNNSFPNAQTMDNSRYQQQGYYWPVSSQILVSNKLISQTPYWNGKTTW